MCAADIPPVSAQQNETVRQFLAECAKGKGDYGCTVQVGGLLSLANGTDGPFCSGTPPADISRLPSAQFDALTGSVIQWLNAHPKVLDMELTAGTLTAMRTLYPCHH